MSEEEEEKEPPEVSNRYDPEEVKKFHNTIKGELEELMGTVICHSPISLWDHDKKKLELTEKDLDASVMYPKFKEKYMKNFKFPTETDEFRPIYANMTSGGLEFGSEKTTSLIRGMGWDLLKQIGQKLLSGDFNLTKVTIPIKVMVPISILQHVCNGHFNFPLYLNMAAEIDDYLERMKLLVVATLSCWYRSSVILKPLNPIWGETYEMVWEDGSREYVEQTCHHPPCSNFIIYGPNNNYKYSGYLDFTSHAWINSMKLINNGNRMVEFKDGSIIKFDYSLDEYFNTFWGVFRHESTGELHWDDITHGLKAHIELGGNEVSKMSDYFDGEITDKDGNVLSNITGSFLSHIDFDGKRYWDIRHNIDIEAYPVKDQIKSSSIYRKDSLLLYQRKMDEAQEAKTEMEEIQRRDRKLRAKWKEKREEEEYQRKKKKEKEKKEKAKKEKKEKKEKEKEEKAKKDKEEKKKKDKEENEKKEKEEKLRAKIVKKDVNDKDKKEEIKRKPVKEDDELPEYLKVEV